MFIIFFKQFFLAFNFCRFCAVIQLFYPRYNGQWPPTSKDFYPRFYNYIIFLSYFLRKSQYFPFQCWVQNKGTTGTIFIKSLVWRSPWLGIEPGTFRTRCQHSTTRLSRRRFFFNEYSVLYREISLPTPPLKLWKHAFV